MAARLGYVRISQDMQGHVEHGILGLSICQDIIILGHLRSGIQGLCKARICWDILEHLKHTCTLVMYHWDSLVYPYLS